MPSSTYAKAGRAILGIVAVGLAVCSLTLTLDAVSDQGVADSSSHLQGPEFVPRVGPQVDPQSIRFPSAMRGYVAEPRVRDAAAGAPRGVQIEALGVDAPVVPIHLEGSTLVPPADPQTLGWWADGAEPGAKDGSALITGHTVHTGGGALDNLERLTAGDVLTVQTDAGAIEYWVSRVVIYDKVRIARAAHRLFNQDVRGRLVLITCEDWDGTGYNSNVVVIARPL